MLSVNISTFPAEFLALESSICPITPFLFFILPQIFLHFPADCGSCNASNKDERRGEKVTWMHILYYFDQMFISAIPA